MIRNFHFYQYNIYVREKSCAQLALVHFVIKSINAQTTFKELAKYVK